MIYNKNKRGQKAFRNIYMDYKYKDSWKDHRRNSTHDCAEYIISSEECSMGLISVCRAHSLLKTYDGSRESRAQGFFKALELLGEARQYLRTSLEKPATKPEYEATTKLTYSELREFCETYLDHASSDIKQKYWNDPAEGYYAVIEEINRIINEQVG